MEEWSEWKGGHGAGVVGVEEWLRWRRRMRGASGGVRVRSNAGIFRGPQRARNERVRHEPSPSFLWPSSALRLASVWPPSGLLRTTF